LDTERAPDRTLISFACEAEPVMSLWRPPKNQVREKTPGPNRNTGVKTIMAFSSRLRLSSVAESRVIFWNLLFTITLSSALLLVYLKKILFDF